jgi:hypothetical protein
MDFDGSDGFYLILAIAAAIWIYTSTEARQGRFRQRLLAFTISEQG